MTYADFPFILILIAAFTIFFLLGNKKCSSLPSTILCCTIPLIWIFYFFPNFRIYSYHGLWHTSIGYNILNNGWAVENPHLAGHPINYYWAFHWLAALFVKNFQISFSWGFAIINMLSMIGSACFIYAISRLIIKDNLSNALSALIALYGTSLIIEPFQNWVNQNFGFMPLPMATPIANKFFNVNGMPIGIMFVLMCIYAIFILYANPMKNIKKGLMLLLMALLGTGLFYPPLLIQCFGMIGALFVLNFVPVKRWPLPRLNSRLNWIFISAIPVSVIVLLPYMKTYSSNVHDYFIHTDFGYWPQKIINICFYTIPLLVLIQPAKKHFKQHVHQKMYSLLWALILICYGMYAFLFMHGNEYKYLVIGLTGLGILGGMALGSMYHKRRKILALTLTLIFLFDGFSYFMHIARINHFALSIIEEKTNLLFKGEESEAHAWIRENTPKDAIIIEYDSTAPVFAQRTSYIGLGLGRSPGYNCSFLYSVCHVPLATLLRRRQALINLFRLKKIDPVSRKELAGFQRDIYLFNTEPAGIPFYSQKYKKVFVSSKNNYSIFQLNFK